MKNQFQHKSYFIFLLFYCFGNAQDTTYMPSSDCTNYNSFVNDSNFFYESHFVTPYENGTLYTDLVHKVSYDTLINSLGLDSNTSFQFTFSLDDLQGIKYYSRFQQYYNGILVVGGGFTIGYIRNGGDPNPCDILYSFAPRILTEIDVNTTPSISSTTAISNFTSDTIYRSELIITHNLLSQCEYRLVWSISYNDTVNKSAYIDAHSGEVLLLSNSGEYLNATTQTYGTQSLVDHTDGNGTHLESPDLRIKILDFDNYMTTPYPSGDYNFGNWKDKPSPVWTSSTGTSGWWTTEAPAISYQALYATDKVLPKFDQLKYDGNKSIGSLFTHVRVGTATNFPNSKAYRFDENPKDIDYQCILIGVYDGAPLALFDVISHELTHIFLRNFLSSLKKPAGSLHEGLADIFGTFIESEIQPNGVDWVYSDDEAGALHRDLSNPGSNADCYSKVINNSDVHKRGQPLGYWYYLISTGKTSPYIPSLGLDKAIEIIIGSLKDLGDNSDYKDLMNATLSYVLEKYGRCSDEFRAVAQAWELICVPTAYGNGNGIVPGCSMAICQYSTSPICEESNNFEFCVCGQYPNDASFNWTIIGPKSTEFSSYRGMQGNSQTGGDCLNIINIPSYNYYPQYIKIRLYSPTLCDLGIKPCLLETVIKIEDCNNDDPYCDYPEFEPINITNITCDSLVINPSLINAQIKWNKLKVYDVYGRLLAVSETDLINNNNFQYKGFALFAYYNKNGELIKTVKKYVNPKH